MLLSSRSAHSSDCPRRTKRQTQGGTPVTRRLIWLLAVVTLLGAACTSSGGNSASEHQPSRAPTAPTPSSSSSSETYAPHIDAADFSANVDNPWFPLNPGS